MKLASSQVALWRCGVRQPVSLCGSKNLACMQHSNVDLITILQLQLRADEVFSTQQ